MRFPLIALNVLLACIAMQTSAHAAGNIETGRAVFDRKCASCHKIGPAARGTFGPISTPSSAGRLARRATTAIPKP